MTRHHRANPGRTGGRGRAPKGAVPGADYHRGRAQGRADRAARQRPGGRIGGSFAFWTVIGLIAALAVIAVWKAARS